MRQSIQAEELAALLCAYAEEQASTVDEALNGLFELTSVMPSWVWIRGHGRAIGPIDLPEDICALCRVNWMITGVVGRIGRKWQFIEVWNVNPSRS